MIDRGLYPSIYKRKTFHLFRNIGNEMISSEEQTEIVEAYKHFSTLCPNVKTAIRIVPEDETTCRRGEEYCILMYSEKKENCLQNILYIYRYKKQGKRGIMPVSGENFIQSRVEI